MDRLNFREILKQVKNDPFSESSMVYMAAGAAAAGFLFLTKRDKLMNYSLTAALDKVGIDNVYLHNLLEGKALSQLLNTSGEGKPLAIYEFVSDMMLSDILGLLKKNNHNKLNTLVAGKTVGDVLDESNGKMKFVPEGLFAGVTLGDLLGTDGAKAIIADIPANEVYKLAMGEGKSLPELLYTYAGDQIAYDLIKDAVVGADLIQNIFGTKTIADLIDYDEENDKYSFNMNIFNDTTVGTLLGYTEDANGNWVKDGVAAEGILAVVAGLKIVELERGVSEIKIGDVLGYDEYVKVDAEGNPVLDTEGNEIMEWFVTYYGPGDERNIHASGVTLAFCNLTVDDMAHPDKVQDAIQTVHIGDVMGYYYDELTDEWYNDSSMTSKPTGVIAHLASSTVATINTDIETIKIGELL